MSGLAKVWNQRGALAWLLWPLSLVYGMITSLRRSLYALGVFKTNRVRAKVIVVGNVVAGGAGKTPVVMALVMHLQARGWQVGVASRGYGRSSTDCREVLDNSTADEVGDEPALIKSTCHAPVFVAAKRFEAAGALLAKYPETQIIVCDDGLQHHALHRDLEICVFDDRGLGNGFLLPAGPLREAWPRKVDFVVHTGERVALTGGFHAPRHLSRFAKDIHGARIPLAELAGQPVVAVAAIARPELFFAMLRAQGLRLAHTLALPDHHDFQNWKRPFGHDLRIVCTEKDAVKLWPQQPDVLAVPMALTPNPAFFAALDQAVKRLRKS